MIKLLPNKNIGGIYFAHKKILRFESRQDIITDNDITDLFMGLINLIKKSTEIKLEEKYMKIINAMKSEIELLKNKVT